MSSPTLGSVAEPVEAMNVWKIVKNKLPFFGGRPARRISSGLMRTQEPGEESSKAEKAL
jgi:hypothetical protein